MILLYDRFVCLLSSRPKTWRLTILRATTHETEGGGGGGGGSMTSVSPGHIILTLTQPVGSGRPQQGSNPGPPHQESQALPTELRAP